MLAKLSYLLGYLESKKLLVYGYFALIMESCTPAIAMFFQKSLIDLVFDENQLDMFIPLLLLYGLFFFGTKFWFTIRRVTFSRVSYNLQGNLVSKFLSIVYDLPNESLKEEQLGKLLNNVRTDIADACDLSINQLMSESIKTLLTIILLTGLLLSINVAMTIIVLAVTLFYYILLNSVGKKSKELSHSIRKEKGNISVRIEESVSGIREVIANNRESWQIKQYDLTYKEFYKAVIKERIYRNIILMFSEPLLFGTKLGVIFLGSVLVLQDVISIGEFVISFSLVDQIITELGLLFNQALTGKRMIASVECIQSIMDKDISEYGIETLENIESIQFNEVSFSYSDTSDKVLKDLSFEFPVGKKIAIVGESGCGKSTIAQLLIRAYQPNEGEVLINKKPTGNYNNSYTDNMTIVFQQPHFIPTSVLDNLKLGNIYDEEKIMNVSKKMLCHDFIMNLPDQYDTWIGEKGTNISGGQRQRLALTRALLRNSDVLILDEATSALDMTTENIVQNHIDEIRKNKTTIIIAHRISTIKNADIIFVMDKGTIVNKGTHDELIKSSRIYNQLNNLQLCEIGDCIS